MYGVEVLSLVCAAYGGVSYVLSIGLDQLKKRCSRQYQTVFSLVIIKLQYCLHSV
jgi:hypothetical protein